MFKEREIPAFAGGDFPPARLSRSQILQPTLGAAVRQGIDRLDRWRHEASIHLARLDLAPDLAQEIGSRRWVRGAATLLALSSLALSNWPGFAPLRAAPAMSIDDAVRDEFRSQMIMPLALGGDSGRRMGATALVRPLRSAPERPRIELEAKLAPGDRLPDALVRAGAAPAEVSQIAALIASEVPLSEIGPGTKVELTLGRRPAAGAARPVEGLSFRARFDLQLALERRAGRLVLDPRPIKVDDTPLRVRGVVGESLYLSARAAGAPAEAVQQYLRALASDMDSDNAIAPGDEFDLIVDYKRAATGEAQPGKLLFAGLARDGKPKKQLLRWGSDGRFYEAAGVGETRTGMFAPVAGRVTSGYGYRRHPILGYTRLHAGIDFAAAYGSPIYAATDGIVQFAGYHGGHGNFVKLSHGGGLGTGYAHMSRIAVSPGMHVSRGQVIGYVGSTGLSTGAHLHYEVYRNGATVNPAGLQFVMRAQLSGSELAAFRSRLADLLQVKPGAALAAFAPETSGKHIAVREINRLDASQPTG